MSERSNTCQEGDALKRAALALLGRCRSVLIRRGRRALLRAVLERGRASIDAVRDVVPIPPGIAPKLFGTVPGVLAGAGLIRACQAARTSRPLAHARRVTVWELADRKGAFAWLAAHPELPDPDGAPATCPPLPHQHDLFN
jgi:hypothetical protein